MNKINFINNLTTISDSPIENRTNFDNCMKYEDSVNILYDAIRKLADKIDTKNEIILSPVDFSKFTIPPGEFKFRLPNKIKKVLDCNSPLTVIYKGEIIECAIRQNEQELGYVISTCPKDRMEDCDFDIQ